MPCVRADLRCRCDVISLELYVFLQILGEYEMKVKKVPSQIPGGIKV